MLIIRTPARLFEHILPLIKEQESKSNKYIRDEDDGPTGMLGINLCCCKRVYFDDGKDAVIYENRAEK